MGQNNDTTEHGDKQGQQGGTRQFEPDRKDKTCDQEGQTGDGRPQKPGTRDTQR